MKRFAIVLAALAMMMSTAAFGFDGAADYKAKCAMCHGAAGEGKGTTPAIKGKANVADVVTKGGLKGPHAKPIAGLTEEQAKAIATFLK
jgi:mono/diheme cytochrome c family protein